MTLNDEKRDVLLLAHTVLSLRYVREHYELLASDPRLRFAVTQAADQRSKDVEEAIEKLVEDSWQDPNKADLAPISSMRQGDILGTSRYSARMARESFLVTTSLVFIFSTASAPAR